jgi:hypothetical protein
MKLTDVPAGSTFLDVDSIPVVKLPNGDCIAFDAAGASRPFQNTSKADLEGDRPDRGGVSRLARDRAQPVRWSEIGRLQERGARAPRLKSDRSGPINRNRRGAAAHVLAENSCEPYVAQSAPRKNPLGCLNTILDFCIQIVLPAVLNLEGVVARYRATIRLAAPILIDPKPDLARHAQICIHNQLVIAAPRVGLFAPIHIDREAECEQALFRPLQATFSIR